MAEKSNDLYKYSFYTPDVMMKESDKEVKGEAYAFYARNFKEAVGKLKKICEETDLTHLNAFVSDIGYLSQGLITDVYYLKSMLKISPLIKFYISESGSGNFFECVDLYFDGDIKRMSNSMFSGNSKKLLCTMSEMIYASENTLFTATIPVIELSPETQYPINNSAIAHNFYSGNAAMVEKDYNLYKEFIENNGKNSSGLNYKIHNNAIMVEIHNDPNSSFDISELAQRYNSMGFDIFNVVFFSKKCFADYESYINFIGNLTSEHIKYSSGK